MQGVPQQLLIEGLDPGDEDAISFITAKSKYEPKNIRRLMQQQPPEVVCLTDVTTGVLGLQQHAQEIGGSSSSAYSAHSLKNVHCFLQVARQF